MSGVNAVQSTSQQPSGSNGNQDYYVRAGDTLSGIAASRGISLARLEAANPQILHPDLIRPGQHLNIPAAGGNDNAPATYRVERGDTLSGIAARHGLDYHAVARDNGIADPDLIRVGQVLHLDSKAPAKSGPTATAPPGGATTPVGAASATTQGRIDQAVAYFQGQGWTRNQAIGIVANLDAESGMEAGIRQHGGGPGYGLAQWEGPRQAAFAAWAGHDIHGSSFSEQLRFVQHELSTSEAGAGRALSRATSAGDAASIVTRLYERPADTVGEAARRADRAEAIAGR